jgi:hypothetical protein
VGLLDAVFGRSKLPVSKTALLGAVAGADLTVRTELGMEPQARAALAVRAVAASEFERVKSDLEKMLSLAGQDLGSKTSVVTDEYGFVWIVVEDKDFPDVVAAVQIASEVVSEEGFRDQLLCAVFPFADERQAPLHLVYAFKRGSFYAFAPRGERQRDVALELRAHALLSHELPLEREMEYRYPLWGLPFGTR